MTKYGSAAQRLTCDLLRNVIVWVFFLVVPVSKADGSIGWLEVFQWLQLLGFAILVTGIVVYNEMIKVTKRPVIQKEEL